MHGKSMRILALLEEGKTYAEISREVGCSKPNVAQTVKRYRAWNRIVAPLPEQHHKWIVDHAKKNRMLPSVYVAKILTKVIGRELENESGD